ncbi:MAG: DUF547 domain-containing protein [Pseudomonadota bacterium]
MSNFDQRMLWVLALVLGMITKPAFCEDSSIYGPFQTLLDRHLSEQQTDCGGLLSWFDYEGALAAIDTLDLLQQQDALLADFNPETLDTRESAIAFWTNAYNYFMVQHLLTHPEEGQIVNSVRDYGSLFQPYRVFGLERFDVGGMDYSLRRIELDVLLGEEFAEQGWKDARVHFAVNCASVGCPPLRQRVYQAANLDQMLTENTRLALDTPLHLRQDGDRLLVTSLFDWYEDDFVEHSGSVRDFITTYGSEAVRAAAVSSDRLRFIDYDWRLNKEENFNEISALSC